ncbi:MAG: DUF4177 domain-containing protein [Candidatus Heimdallarchaeota archaeon]
MQKYEYKIVPLMSLKSSDETLLNEHGAEGWELLQIIVHPIPKTPNNTMLYAIFKRP